jgi:hypothetical protein
VFTWTCRPENAFLTPAFRRGGDDAAFGDYAAEWGVIGMPASTASSSITPTSGWRSSADRPSPRPLSVHRALRSPGTALA